MESRFDSDKPHHALSAKQKTSGVRPPVLVVEGRKGMQNLLRESNDLLQLKTRRIS